MDWVVWRRIGRDNGSCLYMLSRMLELVETTGHVCIYMLSKMLVAIYNPCYTAYGRPSQVSSKNRLYDLCTTVSYFSFYLLPCFFHSAVGFVEVLNKAFPSRVTKRLKWKLVAEVLWGLCFLSRLRGLWSSARVVVHATG